MKYTHAFAIPTRNRLVEVLDVLDSLNQMRNSCEIEVFIAENSDSNEIFDVLKSKISGGLYGFANIQVFRSPIGSSVARNFLIDRLNVDIVTFIDDDILLPAEYAESMDKLFAENPNLVGSSPYVSSVGNLDTAKVSANGKPSKFRTPGLLNEWGINNWFDEKPVNPQLVNWLPGCAMTLRLDNLQGIRFNEDLQNGPGKGYALGEDVDFSYRLNKKGVMLINSDLEITHKLSDNNRINNYRLARALGYFDAHLVKSFQLRPYKLYYINLKILIYSLSVFSLKGVVTSSLRLFTFSKELMRDFF